MVEAMNIDPFNNWEFESLSVLNNVKLISCKTSENKSKATMDGHSKTPSDDSNGSGDRNKQPNGKPNNGNKNSTKRVTKDKSKETPVAAPSVQKMLFGNKEKHVKEKSVKKNVPEEPKSKTKSSDGGDISNNSSSGEWTCSKCTLRNPSSATQCSICEAHRVSRVPTCIPELMDVDPVIPSQRRGEPDGQEELTRPQASLQIIVNPTAAQVAKQTSQPFLSSKPSGSGSKMAIGTAASSTGAVVKNVGATPSSSANQSKVGIMVGKASSSTSGGIVASSSQDDKSEWTCHSCSYSCNPPWMQRCDICDSPKEQKSTVPMTPIEFLQDSVKYHKTPSDVSQTGPQTSVSPGGDVWACDVCTYENSTHHNVCFMCGGSKTSGHTELQWTCSKCTLLNDNDRTKCKACSMGREETSSDSSAEQLDKVTSLPSCSIWKCAICTYNNDGNVKQCKMCNTPKSKPSRPKPPVTAIPGTLQRQESCLMEDMRRLEEREAREQWQSITTFCKEVNYNRTC